MPNAPYDKLLLATGGGIIDAAQQAEQESAAIIAIGLGGTGTDCLRRLKSKVYARVKPDDPNSEVPKYSHIKFLAVDTDAKGMKRSTEGGAHQGADDSLGQIDLQTEYFDISYTGSISRRFKGQRNLLAKDDCYREWLQFDEIEAASADDGAGGIRQLGRFLLFQHASDFVDKVKSVIQSALMDFGTTSVYVHIFSGMSGGTGSGTFLDVCYLVRYAINQLGGLTPKIMGYFFLPDVSLKPGLDPAARSYMQKNGYAAMQELDYCMSFEQNGDSWHQPYPGIGVVSSKDQPVGLCHLVSGNAQSGAVHGDAYDYALNVVTEYVMDFTVKVNAGTGNNVFGLDSYQSNIVTLRGHVPVTAGASNDYLILGSATAVVPHTRIMTYLAAGALRGLPKLLGQTPKEGEGIDFGRAIGLTYDQVYQRVTSQANMSFPMPDVRAEDAQANERLVISDWFVKMETDTEGRIAANVGTLTKHLGSYSATESGNAQAGQLSLMAALLRGLREAMADPQRGPAWAAKMVAGGGGYDILAQLNGIKVSARGKLDQENFNLNEKPDNYYTLQQSKQTAFRAAGYFRRGMAYKEFLGATQTLVQSQARVAAYEGVIRVVDELVPQVRALASEFAQPFRDCIARLDATFQADAQYLDSFADGASRYETPIVTMAQVRPSLDEALRGVDGEAVERELLGRLLADSGMAAWGPAGDDQKLAHIVSAYFLERFHEFSTRSITEYLEERYHTTNQQQLSNAIFNDLLTKVNSDAEPLFWSNASFGDGDQGLSRFEYVTVPATASAVQQAAKQLVKNPSDQVRPTFVTDRISVLRVLVGVAMWGYMGSELYEGRTDGAGQHIYQPANVVDGVTPPKSSRNWNLLPSPTPWRVMQGHEDSHDSGTYERAKEASDLFDEAIEKKVIQKDDTEMDVMVMTQAYLKGIRRQAAQGRGYRQGARRQDVYNGLQAAFVNREYVDREHVDREHVDREHEDNPFRIKSPTDLSIDATEYYRDMFVRMPLCQAQVRGEIAKVDEIAGYIDELAPRQDTDLRDLSNALFTGVIRFVNMRRPMTYTDEWGDETVLARPAMPYGGAPLYQAYLTFKGLPEQLRKEIVDRATAIAESDEINEEGTEESTAATEACRAVSEEIKRSGGATGSVAFVRTAFPAEEAACKDVLHDIKNSLEAFMMQHFIEL